MNVNPELVQRIANLPQENLDVREIMRLSSTASVEEITKRFREFSRKFLRPDKNPAQLEAAQKAFQKMRGAIEELERLAQQDPRYHNMIIFLLAVVLLVLSVSMYRLFCLAVPVLTGTEKQDGDTVMHLAQLPSWTILRRNRGGGWFWFLALMKEIDPII